MLSTTVRFEGTSVSGLPGPGEYNVKTAVDFDTILDHPGKKNRSFGLSERGKGPGSYLGDSAIPGPDSINVKSDFLPNEESISKAHIQHAGKKFRKKYAAAESRRSVATGGRFKSTFKSSSYLVGPGSYQTATDITDTETKFSRSETTFGVERRLELVEVMQRYGQYGGADNPGPMQYFQDKSPQHAIGNIENTTTGVRDEIFKNMKKEAKKTLRRSRLVEDELCTDYDGLNRTKGLFEGSTISNCILRMKQAATSSPKFGSYNFGTATRFSKKGYERTPSVRWDDNKSPNVMSTLDAGDRKRFKELLSSKSLSTSTPSLLFSPMTTGTAGETDGPNKRDRSVRKKRLSSTFGRSKRSSYTSSSDMPGPASYDVESMSSMKSALKRSSKNIRCQLQINAAERRHSKRSDDSGKLTVSRSAKGKLRDEAQSPSREELERMLFGASSPSIPDQLLRTTGAFSSSLGSTGKMRMAMAQTERLSDRAIVVGSHGPGELSRTAPAGMAPPSSAPPAGMAPPANAPPHGMVPPKDAPLSRNIMRGEDGTDYGQDRRWSVGIKGNDTMHRMRKSKKASSRAPKRPPPGNRAPAGPPPGNRAPAGPPPGNRAPSGLPPSSRGLEGVTESSLGAERDITVDENGNLLSDRRYSANLVAQDTLHTMSKSGKRRKGSRRRSSSSVRDKYVAKHGGGNRSGVGSSPSRGLGGITEASQGVERDITRDERGKLLSDRRYSANLVAHDTLHTMKKGKRHSSAKVRAKYISESGNGGVGGGSGPGSSDLGGITEASQGVERDISADDKGNELSNRRFSQGLVANDTMHNLARSKRKGKVPIEKQPLSANSAGLGSLAEGSIGAERDVTVDERGITLSNRRFSEGLVANDTMHNLARSKRKGRPAAETQPLSTAPGDLTSLAEGSLGAERDVTVDEDGKTLSNRRFSEGLVQNDTMHTLKRSKQKTGMTERTALNGIYE